MNRELTLPFILQLASILDHLKTVTAWGFCSLVYGRETLESKKIISVPLQQVRRKIPQRTVVALQLQTVTL